MSKMSPRKQRRETEGTLKAAIMDRLRQYRFVNAYRLEDSSASGIPDIVVTARRRTTWWEAKYGDPSFDWGGIQHLQMIQLEQNGFARYIIYRETSSGIKQVAIVKPSEIEQQELWEVRDGFDHDWVVLKILRAHE
jgi:hypothetical protein